jgi:hypothetical protein
MSCGSAPVTYLERVSGWTDVKVKSMAPRSTEHKRKEKKRKEKKRKEKKRKEKIGKTFDHAGDLRTCEIEQRLDVHVVRRLHEGNSNKNKHTCTRRESKRRTMINSNISSWSTSTKSASHWDTIYQES